MGDVHGCIDALDNALDSIAFDPKVDRLWSVGDLVGKGDDSLAVLRRVATLGHAFNMVLGNHELRLLSALVNQHHDVDPTLLPIVCDTHADYWAKWLRQKPLLLRDQQYAVTVTHAGIFPGWSLAQASRFAALASHRLRKPSGSELLRQLAVSPYKQQAVASRPPACAWTDVVLAFTQMRHVDTGHATLKLDFTEKNPASNNPDLTPWFELWPPSQEMLVFGHWSDLSAGTARSDVRCIDTGCVYGGELTILSIPDEQKRTIP